MRSLALLIFLCGALHADEATKRLEGHASRGLAAYRRGDLAGARREWRAALPLAEQLGRRKLQASMLANLGAVEHRLGRADEALPLLQRALAAWRALGDRKQEARVLGTLGLLQLRKGRFEEALASQQASMAIKRALGDRAGIAVTLGNIGMLHQQMGALRQALPYLQQALALKQQLGNRASIAVTLSNLGAVQRGLGRYQQALECHTKALAIHREYGRTDREALALSQIATLSNDLGLHVKAIEHYKRALDLFRALGDPRGAAQAGSRLGYTLMLVGRHELAQKLLEQAAAEQQRLGLKIDLLRTQRSLSQLLLRVEAFQQAHELAARGVAMARELRHPELETVLLEQQGIARFHLGRIDEGQRLLEQALVLRRRLGDRGGEAQLLRNLGWFHHARGRVDQALACRWRAAELQELLRRRAVLGRDRLQEKEQSTIEQSAAWALELALREPQHAVALHDGTRRSALGLALALLELRRGRRLLDRLQARRWAARVRVDPRLLARQSRLAAALDRLDWQLERNPSPEIARRRDALQQELAATTRSIRRQAGSAAEIAYPEPPRLEQVRSALQAGEAVLYTFLPGDVARPRDWGLRTLRSRQQLASHGHAIYLSRDRVQILRLAAPAAEFDRLAASVARAMRQTDRGLPAPAYRAMAARLYRLWLAPLLEHGAPRRLYFVLDGRLHAIAPGALVVSARGDDYTSLDYLARRSEIVTVHSLTHLLGLARDRPAGRTFYGMADPDGSLPAARRELQGVAALLPAGERVLLHGAEATEHRLKHDPRLAGARVLHLASHATADLDDPLQSAVRLSPGQGEDGRLTAAEVLELKLGAELVVLSGCRTGGGRIRRGEGSDALGRIFHAAGVPSTLVSLWRVSDASTAELMRAFYRGWLVERRSKAQALQRACLSLIDGGRWPAPFHWAPFQLQGRGD